MAKCFTYKGIEYTEQELIQVLSKENPSLKATIKQTQVENINTLNNISVEQSVITPTENSAEPVTLPEVEFGTNKTVKKRRTKTNEGSNDGIDLTKANFSTYTERQQSRDKNREIKWLLKTMPYLSVTMVDRLIDKPDGYYAEGMYMNSAVTISTLGYKGVAYHEAFHAIADLFLSPEELNKLGNEEELAEEFRAYMIDEEILIDRFGGLLGKLFKAVKDFVNKLLNPSVGDKYTIFSKIRRGAYKNVILSSSGENKYSSVKSKFTSDQEREIMMNFVYVAVSNGYVQGKGDSKVMKAQLKETAGKTSDSLWDRADNETDNTQKDILETQGSLWADVYDSWDEIIPNTKGDITYGDKFFKYMESYLKERKVAESTLMEVMTEELSDDSSIEPKENYGKGVYHFSTKDGARSEIKLLFSMLRSSEVSAITGAPKFVTFSEVWNTISQTLYGIVDTESKTAYSQMREALADKAKYKPYINQIIQKLDKDDYLKRMLTVTFGGRVNNYSVTEYTKTQGGFGPLEVRIYNANSNTAKFHWVSKWRDSFDNNLVSKDDRRMLSDEYVKKLEYVNSTESIEKLKAMNPDDFYKSLSSGLKYVGFDVPEAALRYISETKLKGDHKQLLRPAYFGTIIGVKSTDEIGKHHLTNYIDKDIEGSNHPFVNLNSTFLKLGEYVASVIYTPGESSIYTSDGPRYIYSQNNFLSKQFSMMKNNKEEFIKEASDSYSEDSHFIGQLKKPDFDLSKLSHEIFLGQTVTGESDSVGFTELPEADEYIERIERITGNNPHIPTLNMADKSDFNNYTGFTFSKIALDEKGALSTKSEAVRQFQKYLHTEYRRIIHNVNHKPLPENRIEFYHGKDRKPGKAEQFTFFTDLNWHDSFNDILSKTKDLSNRDRLIQLLYNTDKSIKIVELMSGDNNDLVRSYIADTLMDRATQTHHKLVDLGVYDKLKKTDDSNFTKALKFEVYSQQAHIEFTKLFTGDPAFYKSLDDLKKRAPETIAPGIDLAILNEEDKYYNAAVIRDVINKNGIPQSYIDASKAHHEHVNKTLKLGLTENEINQRVEDDLGSYEDINEADAQCFITPKRWMQIMRCSAKQTPELKAMFDAIENGKDIPFDYSLTGQAIKGMAYERTFEDLGSGFTARKPTYLKYSQAVLWSHVVKGNPKLQGLLDEMTDKGVDEVVFESGCKVGGKGVVSFDFNVVDGKVIGGTLNPMKLSNRYYKIQQDLPAKLQKKGYTPMGSQMGKISTVNLPLDGDFALPNNEGVILTGHELLKLDKKTDEELSNIGKSRLMDKWGIEEKEDGSYEFPKGTDKLYKFLINNLSQEGKATDDVINSLEMRDPLDSIFQYGDKIKSVLASEINKNNVKVDMEGGALIQVSSVGLGVITENELNSSEGIIYFSDGSKPKGPRINLETGEVESAQILLPYSKKLMDKLKDSKGNLPSPSEIKRILKEAGLLEGIVGYRIPTQAPASIDSLEIIGFLPPGSGDQVMVYTENPGKTGADFDIDKMYIMLPAWEMVNGLPKRVESTQEVIYNKKQRIEELKKQYIIETDHGVRGPLSIEIKSLMKSYENSLKNLKLDIYTSILKNVEMFAANTKSLDIPNLKDDANIIKFLREDYNNLSPEDKYKFLSGNPKERLKVIKQFNASKIEPSLTFTSAKTQIEVKRTFASGKVGVGVWANNSTSHSQFQKAGVWLDDKELAVYGVTNIKNGGIDMSNFYDTQGYRISDSITSLMNGNVDIAKDAYVFDVNANAITSNTIAFMLRAGMPLNIVCRFMSLPVIIKYCNALQAKDSDLIIDLSSAIKKATGKDEIASFDPSHYAKLLSKDGISDMEKSIISGVINEKDLAVFIRLQKEGADLAVITTAFKHDVDGLGKNFNSSIVVQDKVKWCLANPRYKNLDKLLSNTSVGVYNKNSSEFAEKTVMALSLTTNASARNVYQEIKKVLNKDTLTDDIVNDVAKGLQTYVLSGSVDTNIDSEFISQKMNKAYLTKLLTELRTHKTEDGVEDLKFNRLVNDILQVSTDWSKEESREVATITVTTGSLDTIEKNSLIQNFKELFLHSDPRVREIAKELVKISFVSSGFNRGLRSFYDLIPGTSLQGLRSHINNMLQPEAMINSSVFIDQFMRNNWDNTKYVSKLGKKHKIIELENNKIAVTGDVFKLKSYVLKDKNIYSLESKDIAGDIAVYNKTSRLGYAGKKIKLYHYDSLNSNIEKSVYGDKSYSSYIAKQNTDNEVLSHNGEDKTFVLKKFPNQTFKYKVEGNNVRVLTDLSLLAKVSINNDSAFETAVSTVSNMSEDTLNFNINC